ncbi:MAG: hypothetical protein AAF697_07745 [Pseudomonadota bacterium]
MNELSHEKASETAEQAPVRDWRKSMSDHVAYALLVYTGLQIFMTVKALSDGMNSIFPYFALVILVAAIIPACRWYEKRWTGMSDAEAANEAHATAFKRDITGLWALAIILPLTLTGIFKLIL